MKRHRLIVGLTGGIATGKSEVLRELKSHGFCVFSADDSAHEALVKGTPVYNAVLRHFGPAILGLGRRINRSALADIIFNDIHERRILQRIVHPHVLAQMKHFLQTHDGVIIFDIPLLFEAGYTRMVDLIVVVSSSQTHQIQRLKKRNGLNVSKSLKRIRAQWPLARKEARADYIIRNNSTLRTLRLKAKTLAVFLHKQYLLPT